MRISSFRYLVKQGVRNIWTNRLMSFASFCVLLVSMLLIGFATLFIANVNLFIGSVEDRNEVIIFLNDDVTEERIAEMGDELKTMANVSSVSFYSKEDAWNDMKATIDNADELFSYIDGEGDNSPLIDAYRIRVEDIGKMNQTLMQISRMDGIYDIRSPGDFIDILLGLKSMIAVISVIVLTALLVVSLIIIYNTTRASVEFRKKEITIMKYVGATNAFIKIPFFIEGMLMGVLAGGVATLLTWLGYNEITKILTQDTTFWEIFNVTSFIPLDGHRLIMIALCYITGGAVIGAIGTVMSTGKYLKV